MPPLNIAIIGAGPGGLTTALALQKAGHKVDVFERSSFTKARGFRIALGPNALRCLDGVGVTFEAMGARPLKNEIFHHGQNTEWFKTEDFEYVLPRYGYDWAVVNRDDLQRAMIKQASLTPTGMEKIDIHLSSEVTDVSIERKRISLKNGETWKGDMIVIANGVNVNHTHSSMIYCTAELIL
jgi:2-polyprenyl-6-methoxyphenol hydroxylase-like FAD-dependent oxidoreductase